MDSVPIWLVSIQFSLQIRVMTTPAVSSKVSAQAVWSLILGILSITCLWLLGSIPAIILGILSIKRIDQSGGALQGRGIGVAGIVTGGVGILAGLFLWSMFAALMMPAYNQIQSRASQTLEMNRMKQVVLALHAHAADHGGAFPSDLKELVSADLIEESLLAPSHSSDLTILYRTGLGSDALENEAVLASSSPIARIRAVAFVDGHVEQISEAEFQVKYARLFPRQ